MINWLSSWLACIISHLVYTWCSIVYFDSFSILFTHNLPSFLAYSIDLHVAYSNSCNMLCNLYWIPARLSSDTTLCAVACRWRPLYPLPQRRRRLRKNRKVCTNGAQTMLSRASSLRMKATHFGEITSFGFIFWKLYIGPCFCRPYILGM